jgi:antitoxin MazE
MGKIAKLKIQQWGNSLAVRIPSEVARSARFALGQPVEITVEDSGVMVRPVGLPKLSLEQKLAMFDPTQHGGEAMASGRIGVEVF